jgi:hypothetical protein
MDNHHAVFWNTLYKSGLDEFFMNWDIDTPEELSQNVEWKLKKKEKWLDRVAM